MTVLDASAMLAYLQGGPGADDAEWAAARWRRGEGLSLGDRLCLALGHRLGRDVLTADRSWGDGPGVRQVR